MMNFFVATGLLVAAAWSPPNILCPRTPLRPARGAILLHAGTPSTDSLLCSGAAVELWHEGGLAVGNFRSRAEGSNALIVELSSGRSIKVDGGQLVDVWAADAGYPSTPDGWTSLQAEAAGLLAELPPHMLDLRPLWQRLLTEKAAARERVDSLRVAQEYLTSPHRQGSSARESDWWSGWRPDSSSRLRACSSSACPSSSRSGAAMRRLLPTCPCAGRAVASRCSCALPRARRPRRP